MIVYIDMDDVICDYTKSFNSCLLLNPTVVYPQSQFGFYMNLEPIEGAIKCIYGLMDHPIIDPWILTAPSIMNPMCYTEKRIWVENHFGIEFTKKLIISPDKSLLKGGVLIDDRKYGAGQDEFDGELILFGSESFPDWDAVINHLNL